MIQFIRLTPCCVLQKYCRFNLISRNNFNVFSKSRLSGNKPQMTYRFLFSFIGKRSQLQLKEADNIPDQFNMIYRNKMSHYLLGAQIVSVVCGGIVLMGILFKTRHLDFKRDNVEWSQTAKPVKNEDIYYITCFSIFLVLMQVLVARTPIRIYKVPQKPKYVVINYGNYFFGKRSYSFLKGEISRSDSLSILPWKENRYVIQTANERKPVILVDYFFRRPADLSIMLGEQKDPELEEDIK